MAWLQALILGAVQGLTEFFPVSSSGHLALVPKLFGWQDQGLAFDTILHLGTLCALLYFFRGYLIGTLRQAFDARRVISYPARTLIAQIVLGAIPSLVLGFFLQDWIEQFGRNAFLIAFNLVAWSMVLLMADRMIERNPSRTVRVEEVSWRKALFISLAQPLALIPGTSRSGITISAGLFAGLSRETAARFSFLMCIPVTAAAGGYGLLKLALHRPLDQEWTLLLIGFVAALISGAWAIRFLLSFVAKRRYDLFVFYRLALAFVVLFVLLR